MFRRQLRTPEALPPFAASLRNPRRPQASCFEHNPGLIMYGMMCVVYTTGAWLLMASYYEIPVSTTHSTIGGIIGMAIASGGAKCVVWQATTDRFPYFTGMSAIVASWLISPLFSGIMSAFLFSTVRTFVLRSPNAYERSFWVYPILIMVTVAVNGECGRLSRFGDPRNRRDLPTDDVLVARHRPVSVGHWSLAR